MLSPERGTTGMAVGKVVADAQRSGADEDALLLAIATVVLEEVPNDPQTVLELLLWSRAHGDSGLRRHLAERYRILDDAGGRFFTQYLASTGRRLRRGFDAAQLSATIQDISQIVALREAIAPGTYSAEDLAALYRLVLEYMTRSPADRRTPVRVPAFPTPPAPAPPVTGLGAGAQVLPTSRALIPSPIRNSPPRPYSR